MRKIDLTIVRIIVTVLSVLAGLNAAQADRFLPCQAYAAKAVSQQQQNVALKCGYIGARWSTDYNGHFNWCVSDPVKQANITLEDQQRTGALQVCAKKKQANHQSARPTKAATERECNNYRKIMTGYAKDNARFKCGFTDGRFHNNPNGHFNWCFDINNTRKNVVAMMKSAEKELNACVASKKSDAACRFVATAMKPIYGEMNNACANTGVKEPGKILNIVVRSFNEDVAWCLANGVAASNKRIDEMKAKIKRCGQPFRVKLSEDKFSVLWRGGQRLFYDICNKKNGNRCGRKQADFVCRREGFTEAAGGEGVGFTTFYNKQAQGSQSAKADGPAAWYLEQDGGRPCYGDCLEIISITCKGRL